MSFPKDYTKPKDPGQKGYAEIAGVGVGILTIWDKMNQYIYLALKRLKMYRIVCMSSTSFLPCLLSL